MTKNFMQQFKNQTNKDKKQKNTEKKKTQKYRKKENTKRKKTSKIILCRVWKEELSASNTLNDKKQSSKNK